MVADGLVFKLCCILSGAVVAGLSAGRTTTDDELEDMLESGKPSIFISDVSGGTALWLHILFCRQSFLKTL